MNEQLNLFGEDLNNNDANLKKAKKEIEQLIWTRKLLSLNYLFGLLFYSL